MLYPGCMAGRCTASGCDRPKCSRSTVRCTWHWLMKQPADVAATAAERRVTEHLAQVDPGKSVWPVGERWTSCGCGMVPLFFCTGARCRTHASMAAHARRVEKTYGLSAEGYATLLAAQGGRCAICQTRPRKKRLAVDHAHASGQVRGLLCSRCNHDLLGAANEDPQLLRRAADYLERPPYAALSAPPTESDWLQGW